MCFTLRFVILVVVFQNKDATQFSNFFIWDTGLNQSCYFSGIECVRLRDLSIPSYRFRESDATLGCNFDLEGERLYSVKWYKDGHEFYRLDMLSLDFSLLLHTDLHAFKVKLWLLKAQPPTLFVL
jgi:hypothetical protein